VAREAVTAEHVDEILWLVERAASGKAANMAVSAVVAKLAGTAVS
jgi:hypothetical protein